MQKYHIFNNKNNPHPLNHERAVHQQPTIPTTDPTRIRPTDDCSNASV